MQWFILKKQFPPNVFIVTHTCFAVWSYPGFCPTTQPDCPTSTCHFDSYSTSWSDGETMYSYMYEWGNDRDCPKLYKCCNGQGGTGTCVRADGPEPGKGYSFFPN